jgi:flagellar M-ring protein FliF
VRDYINKIVEWIKRFWTETDKKKKILIFGISAVVIIGLTAVILLLTRQNFGLLYGDLSSKDLGEIQSKLTELNITWKSGEDGKSIYIPEENVIKIRNDLAFQGLPKESGYSILAALSNTSWTETNFVTRQKLNYAQQSELSQQIKEMEGILEATVKVDLPEESLFVDVDEQFGTASVTIQIEEGARLSDEKVKAIKAVVAGAYVNLRIEDIFLTDNFGRLYELPDEDDTAYRVVEQMHIKKTMEEDLDKRLSSILATVYGRDNVVARCNIQLNFDREKIESTTYEPPIAGENDGVIRSLERLEEHTKNVATGGIPGTESNVTDYATTEDATTSIDKKHEVINYEYNELKRIIEKSPYTVNGISVSVIINKDLIEENMLTDEYIKEIESAVEYTAGTGSKVSVWAHAFNRPVIEGEGETTEQGFPMWIIAVIIAVVVLIIGIILLSRRKRKQRELEAETMLALEEEVEGIDEIDFEMDQSDYLVQINNFISKKPEIVAQLIRTWLNED